MADCLFCKIVKGEIPCARLLETETMLAFLDINPIRPGHALVVPKCHAETVFDLPPELAQDVFLAIRHVGQAVMQATGAAGLNVIQNNYPASGQEVPHIHWHLIPRQKGDGLTFWTQGAYADMQAMADMAQQIKARLN